MKRISKAKRVETLLRIRRLFNRIGGNLPPESVLDRIIKTAPDWALAEEPWEAAKQEKVIRYDYRAEGEVLDPGVNFFVLTLEHLGARPVYSCEGHGHKEGLYIVFKAPYHLALRIASPGFFSIELIPRKRKALLNLSKREQAVPFGRGWWRLSLERASWKNGEDKARSLNWAAQAWQKEFWISGGAK
jgi:hypothetical protein